MANVYAKALSLLCVFVAMPVLSVSRADGRENQNMPASEEELRDYITTLTSIATKTELSTRESPGIISVISAEEIKNLGARDLMEVLQYVPGFQFASDVQGVVGLGIRGTWAHEGKVLVLLDGQPLNEILYSNFAFGNHIPVDQVKKIEIIRGPGSVVYGGYAELAVINVITKSADDLGGFSVTASYGQTANTYGKRDVSLGYGKRFNDVSVSVMAALGQGNRSGDNYTNSAGTTFSMKGSSDLNPGLFDLGVNYRKLDLRLIVDRYQISDRTAYDDPVAPETVALNFNSYIGSLKYRWDLAPKLSITPSISYLWQQPWKTTDPVARAVSGLYLDTTATRLTTGLTGSYDVTQDINLLAGIEAYCDQAENNDPLRDPSVDLGQVSFVNKSVFGQGMFKTGIANFTLGARYEANNEYGTSFVPRFALTRVFGKLNTKLLVSQSFRVPGIESVQYGQGVKPEKTTTYEVQAGYAFSEKMLFEANVFDSTIREPIVYDYAGGDRYYNAERTGTRGAELEYRYKDRWGYSTVAYSFYLPHGNTIDSYAVPGNDSVLLAFPTHKFTWINSVGVAPKLRVNPSLVYLSNRYGYAPGSTPGQLDLIKFDPVFLLNLYVSRTDFLAKGFEAGVGVNNILDASYPLMQAYNAGHAPIPSQAREFFLKAGYQIAL